MRPGALLVASVATAALAQSVTTAPWRGRALPSVAVVGPRHVLARHDEVVVLNGGFGSGMAVDARNGASLWLLTDRGPNYESGQDLKAFVVPDYSPQLARVVRDGDGLVVVERLRLRRADGRPLSGRPNPAGAGGTGESAATTDGSPLPFDPDGIDPEAVVSMADGGFWIADEYGPWLLRLDAQGRTVLRLAPFTGQCRLPAVLARRRPNRGMEALAGPGDGSVLVGLMQGPLDNPRDAGRRSRLARLVRFEPARCAFAQYIYPLDDTDMMVSDAAWLGPGRLLVLEHDGTSPGQRSVPRQRVYLVELDGATDVNGRSSSPAGMSFGGRTLEQVSPRDLAALGVMPARKTLVADLAALGFPHDKPEGLAVLDSVTLAVANDDDFGVGNSDGRLVPKRLASGDLDVTEVRLIRLTRPLW